MAADFAGVVGVLADAGVEVIVIGGLAAQAHGSARITQDTDFLYRRTPDNIERLAAALAPYQPYLRGAPPGLPFHFDPATIRRGLNFTLTPCSATWICSERSRGSASMRRSRLTRSSYRCLAAISWCSICLP